VLIAGGDDPQVSSQTTKPVSLLQLIARSDPSCGDAVHSLSTVASEIVDRLCIALAGAAAAMLGHSLSEHQLHGQGSDR